MRVLIAAIVLALSLPATSSGQASPAGDDPFARYLFPPERVIGHSREIGLDESQKTAIRSEIQRAQSRFLDLQFEAQAETEKMIRLLQEKPVDEARVLAQVDRILAIEKEVKKTQVSLLIRIKNHLTPAQQSKLAEMAASEAR